MYQQTILGNIAKLPMRKRNGRGNDFVIVPVACSTGAANTQYVDVIFNGKIADMIEANAKSGDAIIVQGFPSLAPRKAQDRIYGNPSIRADYVRLLGKGGKRGLVSMSVEGRCVAAPFEGITGAGDPFTSLRIASNVKVGDQEQTLYTAVSGFKHMAPILAFAEKGQRLFVKGGFGVRTFERGNEEPGAEFQIMTHDCVLLEKSGARTASGEDSRSNQPMATADDFDDDQDSDDFPF